MSSIKCVLLLCRFRQACDSSAAIPERSPTPLYYPLAGFCVIRLNSFAGSAGISDVTLRMKDMLQYALAFGCALIVPRPHDGLTPAHNSDKLLDKSVWWTRYYKVGRGLGLSNGWEWLWESVPVGRPVHTRSVPGDPMPSPEMFAQLRADAIAHGTLELLEVRQWRRGGVSAQLKQMRDDAGEELSAN